MICPVGNRIHWRFCYDKEDDNSYAPACCTLHGSGRSGENCETFYVIEKAQNGDTAYIVTKYELKNDVAKPSGETKLDTNKKQFPAQYKDGILEKDFSVKYYIQDGKLVADKHSYDRVSDKSITFDEMNNGRGYPEPK